MVIALPRNVCSACAVMLSVLITLGGCAATPQGDATATISADQYTQTFDAAVAVLRDRGFVVDRNDHRFGRVTSKPRISPTLVEIWHRDNATFGQAVESSLAAERRVVAVRLDPQANDAPAAPDAPPADKVNPYRLAVEVTIERYQNPRRRMTGSTDGHRVVAYLNQTPIQLQRRGIPGAYWYPVKRDPHMEHRLLADILSRATPDHDAIE